MNDYDPAGNYLFKVNNKNTRTRCEICSKLTIKTPERRHLYPLNYCICSFITTQTGDKECFVWNQVFITHLFFMSNSGQAFALKVAYIFKIFRVQSC